MINITPSQTLIYKYRLQAANLRIKQLHNEINEININTEIVINNIELDEINKEIKRNKRQLVFLETRECKFSLGEHMRLKFIKNTTLIFRDLLRKKEICRTKIHSLQQLISVYL